ncbi:hypothetical protein niasHT_007272 [Heterodera trifolii]|uniref:Uncharacterized protein n=1 Tax=Heterodera trifolii TaxID=157864 RepID=A0ABD2LL65_9BILA
MIIAKGNEWMTCCWPMATVGQNRRMPRGVPTFGRGQLVAIINHSVRLSPVQNSDKRNTEQNGEGNEKRMSKWNMISSSSSSRRRNLMIRRGKRGIGGAHSLRNAFVRFSVLCVSISLTSQKHKRIAGGFIPA